MEVLHEKHQLKACDINYKTEIHGTGFRASQEDANQVHVHNKNNTFL